MMVENAPVTPQVLFRVAGGLMALLALTVGLAFVPLGPFNLVMALVIAAAKAALVVLFFMEVRTSSRLTWIMAGAGLFWLFLLIGGTLADYATRATVALPPPEAASSLRSAAANDEHTWRNANPNDPRNSGNLGPAGGWAPDGIAPSAPAGTPGEPVSDIEELKAGQR